VYSGSYRYPLPSNSKSTVMSLPTEINWR
jgi:hypothetical protein